MRKSVSSTKSEKRYLTAVAKAMIAGGPCAEGLLVWNAARNPRPGLSPYAVAFATADLPSDWVSPVPLTVAQARRLSRLGLHPIILHGFDANGQCTCGNPDHRLLRDGDDEAAIKALKNAGKHPRNRGWTDEAFDLAQLEEQLMAHPESNIGLRMGLQPDGAYRVALDVDDVEAALRVEAELGALPETLWTRSARGGHYVFEVSAEDFAKLTNFIARDGIDLICGRKQVVVGPSMHPFGVRYSTTIKPIAKLPAPWLERLATKRATKAASSAPTGSPPDGVVRDDRWLKHARKALMSVEPSVEGQHGGRHLFGVQCMLQRGWLLPRETADALLLEEGGWNDLCDPPWDLGDKAHREHWDRASKRADDASIESTIDWGSARPQCISASGVRHAEHPDDLTANGNAESAPANGTTATVEDAVNALQDWASDHVRACREELRTPLDLNLACALGVGSAAIAGKIKVRIHANYVSHTAMWWSVVATPGELKTPAYKLASAPIKAWVRETQIAERDDLQRRIIRRADLEARKKKLEKARGERDPYALASDKPNIEEDADLVKVLIELDTPPPEPFEMIVEDITPETVVDKLATHGRIACMSDEGAKVFGVLGGQYSKGQADLSAWLQAIDGTLPKVDRIGRKAAKPQHAEATLSVVLTLQPEVMQRVTGNSAMAGEGLVQRFCWVVAPKVTDNRWAPGELPTPVPTPVTETWDAGIRFLLDLPAQEVKLSSEAHAAYIVWRDELEPRIRRGDLSGDMGGWASKHLDRTARLAALLWACDGAEGVITAEQMARAVTIGRWLVPHAVAAIVGGREAARRDALDRRVLELLAGEVRTEAQLGKALGKAQKADLPGALARLSERGEIDREGSRWSVCE